MSQNSATLKNAQTSLGDPQTRARAAQPGVQRRILLAEDSEDIQQLIAAYLEPTAHQLEIAGNGQTALDKFVASNFDLVLMDSEMPVLDGFAATRRIREWEAQRGARRAVTILAMTGAAISEEFQALCNGYLLKPIRQGTLIKAIEATQAIPQLAALEDHGAVKVAVSMCSPKRVQDLVPRYLVSRKADLERLTMALARADYDVIRLVAHNMKGTGGPYGFPTISAIGMRLEQAAKARRADDAKSQILAFSNYLDQVQATP